MQPFHWESRGELKAINLRCWGEAGGVSWQVWGVLAGLAGRGRGGGHRSGLASSEGRGQVGSNSTALGLV